MGYDYYEKIANNKKDYYPILGLSFSISPGKITKMFSGGIERKKPPGMGKQTIQLNKITATINGALSEVNEDAFTRKTAFLSSLCKPYYTRLLCTSWFIYLIYQIRSIDFGKGQRNACMPPHSKLSQQD